MKIVFNKILPFPGFMAMSFCGIIFVREKYRGYENTLVFQRMVNHEAIHFEQQKELLFIGFFVLYVLEWMFRLVFHTRTAYRGISFEREAYAHETDTEYLSRRKRFSWLSYFRKDE